MSAIADLLRFLRDAVMALLGIAFTLWMLALVILAIRDQCIDYHCRFVNWRLKRAWAKHRVAHHRTMAPAATKGEEQPLIVPRTTDKDDDA